MTLQQLVNLKKSDKFYHLEGDKYREYKTVSKDCILNIVFGIDQNKETTSFKYTDVQIEEPTSSIII